MDIRATAHTSKAMRSLASFVRRQQPEPCWASTPDLRWRPSPRIPASASTCTTPMPTCRSPVTSTNTACPRALCDAAEVIGRDKASPRLVPVPHLRNFKSYTPATCARIRDTRLPRGSLHRPNAEFAHRNDGSHQSGCKDARLRRAYSRSSGARVDRQSVHGSKPKSWHSTSCMGACSPTTSGHP